MDRTQCLTLDFGPCLEYLFSILLFIKIRHHIYYLMNGSPVWAALFAYPKRFPCCHFAFSSPHKLLEISYVKQPRNVPIMNLLQDRSALQLLKLQLPTEAPDP